MIASMTCLGSAAAQLMPWSTQLIQCTVVRGFAWYDYTLVDTDVAINAMMWQMGNSALWFFPVSLATQ